MSVRPPPQVELMREETLKTLSGSSSTRGPTRQPQTWVFLPKASASGSRPKCSWAQHLPGEADARLHLVDDEERPVLAGHSPAAPAGTPARKWLSPPSAWMGSMMMAAMSSGFASKARRISSSDRCSAAADVPASTSAVTGKRSFGFVTRGQGNLGKRSVLQRVGVGERERVARAAVEGLPEVEDLLALVARDAPGPVPAHLPVERGLERVLDAERPALDEEGVAQVGGHGQAREGVDEGRVLDAVDVGERRLELRHAVEHRQEVRVLHARVVVADGARGEEGAGNRGARARPGVVEPRAVAPLEVEDDVVAVGEDVAGEDAVDIGRGEGGEAVETVMSRAPWKGAMARVDGRHLLPTSFPGRTATRALVSTI